MESNDTITENNIICAESDTATNTHQSDALYPPISKEEEYRINKLFNIVQVPIVNFIMRLVNAHNECDGGAYDNIFSNKIKYSDLTEEPIILGNLEQLHDKFVRISFRLNSDGQTANSFANNKLDDDIMNYVVRLILDATAMVFNYIIDQFVINKKNKDFLSCLHFEINTTDMTLYPVAISPQRRRMFMLQDILEKIGKIKNDVVNEQRKLEIDEAEKNVQKDLAAASALCSQAEESMYIAITSSLIHHRIEIIYEEIEKKDIPASMLPTLLT